MQAARFARGHGCRTQQLWRELRPQRAHSRCLASSSLSASQQNSASHDLRKRKSCGHRRTPMAQMVPFQLATGRRLFCSATTSVIEVPAIDDYTTEGTVATFEKAVGDYVNVDDIVAILETDKFIVDVRSPIAGLITKINAAEGDDVPVGMALFDLDISATPKEGASVVVPEKATSTPAAPAPAPAPTPPPSPTPTLPRTAAPAAPIMEAK